MVEIASMSDIADKWQSEAQAKSDRFADGIRNARKSWHDNTLAAMDGWRTAVRYAVENGHFEWGVERAGTGRWRSRTLDVGVDRYRTKMGAEETLNDYETAMEIFQTVLADTDIPDREYEPSDDAVRRNTMDRAWVVAQALFDARQRGEWG